MIAFEISINGQKRCIAGIPGHHTLFALVTSNTIENKPSILFHVQGNDLDVFKDLNFSDDMTPQEKLPQIVALITKQGMEMKEWVRENFDSEVKIDIRIVEIEPELLSEGKVIATSMENFAAAAARFLGKG